MCFIVAAIAVFVSGLFVSSLKAGGGGFGPKGKASGNWVGIEIDEAKGDCSGDFGGKLFFECKLMHGIFLRPTQVKIIDSFQTVGVSRSVS